MRKLVTDLFPRSVRNRIRSKLPSFVHNQASYAQCGEDLLISFALKLIHGNRAYRYLDIGANDPVHLSNTALLYRNGGHGILVEPDPYYAGLLRRKRKRDTIIEGGVHFSGEAKADFYILDSPTLNTFSKEEMEHALTLGHQLQQTISVPLHNVNDLLKQAGELDFLNLDIEGLDHEVLKQIDWETHRPTCICVETVSYEEEREPEKLTDIVDFMAEHEYTIYADTFINSIFVDQRQWTRRWEGAPS